MLENGHRGDFKPPLPGLGVYLFIYVSSPFFFVLETVMSFNNIFCGINL